MVDPVNPAQGTHTELPDPGGANTLDEVAARLRALRTWAGEPSYAMITERVNSTWIAAGRPAADLARRSTIVDCFKTGRRRVNTDLVIAVVAALHPDEGYVTQWRQALRVVGGEMRAAAQVRVRDKLPPPLSEFTGRAFELRRLREALHRAQGAGRAVLVTAIAGMAGVGKTQLAIQAGHLLHEEEPFAQVLFVNLRGFHPDPSQPPADPAAVLDGFLRLLGMPGHQIPHGLAARTTAYRQRLQGMRVLVVLDNASGVAQVRPLLPGTPGCVTLITSRRHLGGLRAADRLAVDVFTVEEAETYLRGAVAATPVGADPQALQRIAVRCGYLPLALGLVAGHIRATPGWTLTDHADRLDERHRYRHLDTGVQMALDVSYHDLPESRRQLMRLASLHPGQDFDAYAAAALCGTDLATAASELASLCDDHLLLQTSPGRYQWHDLVRAYAAVLATDQDPPSARHDALTRLFDHYLATAAAAVDTLYPAEAHHRPRIPAGGILVPDVATVQSARAWLETERPTLVAVAAHTASQGWPTHATRLSTILWRYLSGGHLHDAFAVHGSALHAAARHHDVLAQAHALANLGTVHLQLGRHDAAADHLRQALALFAQTDDRVGRARALANLSVVQQRLGRYRPAAGLLRQALALLRRAGDRTGEANALGNLGFIEQRLGRYKAAADHHLQAFALHRLTGDRSGEANTLTNLGEAEIRLGRLATAEEHLRQALALYQGLGNHSGEASTWDSLGSLCTQLGELDDAAEHHKRSLDICRDIGHRYGQAAALNGLGEATHAAGLLAEAARHHHEALAIAAELGAPDQQARAYAGLGLADPANARAHFTQALAIYTNLGLPQAIQIQAHLDALPPAGSPG